MKHTLDMSPKKKKLHQKNTLENSNSGFSFYYLNYTSVCNPTKMTRLRLKHL